MIFWKLNSKHKKWFLINQIAVITALLIALILSWNISKIELPSEGSKLVAGFGFITTFGFFIAAALSRIGNLFKIKSVGFVFIFFMFLGLQYIIVPMTWAVGLMLIPMVIDDLVFQPIWQNIWYNNYDNFVKVIPHE